MSCQVCGSVLSNVAMQFPKDGKLAMVHESIDNMFLAKLVWHVLRGSFQAELWVMGKTT